MPTAIFGFRLKPGVSPEDYQRWVVEFDYPRVQKIPSIVSQRIYQVRGMVLGGGQPPYQAIEVISFTDLESYLNDLKNHPDAQAIAAQLPNYVEMGELFGVHGVFIPPGVSRTGEVTVEQGLSDIAQNLKRIADTLA